MILLGLTGSIGMGKSTTAAMFAEAGVPVWDADACVHRLYEPGAPGSQAIDALIPEIVSPDIGVDRGKLRIAILNDPALLGRIEAVIHPLVAADRETFLQQARDAEATVALCDIPLLFETGADTWLDKIAVVTAPKDVQRARVLDRPNMTDELFASILAKQTPDAEKRAKADYIIDTSQGFEAARARVHAILEELNA
ncbi:MAG: dephospho-CoA kinase [Pseudomonadota bacterium]